MRERAGFRVLGSRALATTTFLRAERQHLIAPDGAGLQRAIIRHPGAVAAVPVVDESVVLIRQYRAPVGHEVLEIPAGKLDVYGEDPRDAAARELAEEIGYRPGNLELIASFYTGPGFTDERLWLYLATDLVPVAVNPAGIEEEHSEVVKIPIDRLPELIADGEFEDAKTLVGLLALLRS
jgi:ADP-ribose pyrophosphatase